MVGRAPGRSQSFTHMKAGDARLPISIALSIPLTAVMSIASEEKKAEVDMYRASVNDTIHF
ncbi:hypothetical protein EIT25_18580 [Salmonella enterica]|nr:hypothetical protein [Salmonella enterica]ECS7456475.1 hypothetical protein [Salmonella enterica subsp. enterica serovar Javiana]EAM4147250.1 hypothetical protein [Salmonella enterica]EAM4170233.1 hypothetical protein [Salmonella enterica]EAN3069217.1 hypothetical protein [Salmonella enterica]